MDRKHWWIMILCCLIPIVAVAAISVLGVPGNSVLYFGLFLLCPLLHLVMMRGMMSPQGEHQHRPTSLESDQVAPDRE
jgi:uncharacterized membrane protein